MTAPIPRHVSGELVRVALMNARPAGLGTIELVETTSLTPSQVANGILWIRRVAASEHLTPLTWSGKDGYRFSDDPTDWIAYELSQIRRLLTSLVHLDKGTLDPHLARRADDEFARMLNDQLVSMISTLEFMSRQQPT